MEIKDNKSIEKDELTGDSIISGHEYDDIKELDNRLPRWWLWLFILSCVWGVVYLFVYDVFKVFPHQEQEYKNEIAGNPLVVNAGFDTNQVALTDPASIAAGKDVFDKQCVACHLSQGQGKIGPNLCDTFSIHGCSFRDYLKIIKHRSSRERNDLMEKPVVAGSDRESRKFHPDAEGYQPARSKRTARVPCN